MNTLFPKIRGIVFTLMILAIIELIMVITGLNESWNRILSIAIPILNILLFNLLLFLLVKVIRQSTNKDQQYQELLDLSPEAIYVHRKGRVIYSNEAGVKLFGLNKQTDLNNRPWKEILGERSYSSLKESSARYETDQQFKIHHFNLYREDGSVRHIEAKSTYINFDGEPAREVMARDITLQEQKQKRLEEFSYLDALTNLPNRRSLLDQLDQIILESKRENKCFGMMFLDLDGFKTINDTYGHDKGDLLLRQVGEYLRLSIGKEDVVGRFGGDEFIIILPDAKQTECVQIAKKIIDHMPLFIIGQGSKITLSIGISLYPNHGKESSALIKQADEAMYQAKDRGKNTYQILKIPH